MRATLPNNTNVRRFQRAILFFGCFIGALLLNTQAHSQTTNELLGKWVNVYDTSSKLLLYKNGKARLVFQDTAAHGQSALEGFWRHKEFRRLLSVYIGPGRRQQDYKTYQRGRLGMTLNTVNGSVVFARRALEQGEALPEPEQK